MSANIILTNGPTGPASGVYVGAGRTNILLCQASLTSDVTTYGFQAYGMMTIKSHIKNPALDHSIMNLRCVDSAGNVFDYPYQNDFGHPGGVLSGYGSNDGTESGMTVRFYQYIGSGAFAPQPGAPVTISIVADLGPGWESGDAIETSVDTVKFIIADGDYYSPIGPAKSSINTLADAAYISGITNISPSKVNISALGKPGAAYDIEASSSLKGGWVKVNGSPIISNDTGNLSFDYTMVPGEDMKFFRFAY